MRSQNPLRLVIRAFVGCAVFVINTPVVPAQMQGFPEDWTHHHVVFSNPGTLQDAIKNGSFDRWIRIVNDPRYQIQQMKRNATAPPIDGGGVIIIGGGLMPKKKLLHPDWAVTTSNSVGNGGLQGEFPAKYVFDVNAPPDCANDYVVFPTAATGSSSTQANILGVNNLYNATCSGTVPTVPVCLFHWHRPG